MFNKPFTEIEIEDINKLVYERKERENNNLEYKQELNNTEPNKQKLLKAVSGFANASGGFLIIGVTEKDDGTPDKICGIEKKIGNQKIDEWINNVLISNIDEKVRYEPKVFDIENNRVVVVLYIPESPKKPHMVTFDKKNIYFIRHNTSVNPATQSEVREMFEYSKKNRDEFEKFLKKRNIFDENDNNFGINENSNRLFNRKLKEKVIEKPIVLYSFIPRYLDENRVNTASLKILDWLQNHSNGIEPFQKEQLFTMYNREINLYGIVCPRLRNNKNLPNDELYSDYFEFLNNGFFESGLSRDLTFDFTCKNVLCLTYIVGYAWLLFNFAKKYFNMINYYDEVWFQLSVANVKGFALSGFIKDNHNWLEPCTYLYNDPPVCSHEKFKIPDKFIVSELSDELIKQHILNLAKNISLAFGELDVKCFDDNGNFNNDGFMWFRQ